MRKSILARTALVATIATVTGAGVALPAAAATSTSHYTVQAQLDNNPGSGAGWVWVYSGSDNNGRVDYQFYDGSIRSLHTGWWTASSTDPGHPVVQTAMLGVVEMPPAGPGWGPGRWAGRCLPRLDRLGDLTLRGWIVLNLTRAPAHGVRGFRRSSPP